MVSQEINIIVDNGFDGATTGINMFEVRKSQIPEPGTLSLFAVGLAGLTYFGWRRRRKTVNAA